MIVSLLIHHITSCLFIVPLEFQTSLDERCYQSLLDLNYNNQQNEDAPLDRKHPLYYVVLHRMHSWHIHISHNDDVVCRDIRLCNVFVALGA